MLDFYLFICNKKKDKTMKNIKLYALFFVFLNVITLLTKILANIYTNWILQIESTVDMKTNIAVFVFINLSAIIVIISAKCGSYFIESWAKR